MTYSYVGTMRARPGRRDDVIAILLSDQSELAASGCHAYVVGKNDDDPDLIHVVELWESKQAHDDSLQLESTRAAIEAAMPLLTGEFTSREFTVVGGVGAGPSA